MNKHRPIAVMAGALVGLLCAAATAGAATTSATVAVTITVLPYASVTLTQQTPLTVTIAGGQTTYGPVYVGGTIGCNCPVMLFADISPPAGAPGRWYATAMVSEVNELGVHTYLQLVRIFVANIPAESAGTFSLEILGTKLGDYPYPQAGQVVVTVMLK